MNQPLRACILCGADLSATAVEGVLWHPESDVCTVVLADAYGVSADEEWFLDDAGEVKSVHEVEKPVTLEELALLPDDLISLVHTSGFVSVEWGLEEIFTERGISRLGGASGDRGWSSISSFQKCPYLWKRKYLGRQRVSSADGALMERAPKSEALEVGSIVHAIEAVRLVRMMDPCYPLEPEELRDLLLEKHVTPEFVSEAWRVLSAYWLYYRLDHEDWEPLAVEHHVVDPRTRQSCRIDAIMYKKTTTPGQPEGTYLWDHKTAARFDFATKEGWKNDGEIIGIADLYNRLHMEKRFGPMVGMVVNVLGKQKTPDFIRNFVWPSRAVIHSHRVELRIWSAAIEQALATGLFPRARAACVGRYGFLCDESEHCAQAEAPVEDVRPADETLEDQLRRSLTLVP